MQLFVDALNIKSGGGLTHLYELLMHYDPQKIGFSQIIVIAPPSTLDKLPNRPLLTKMYISTHDKGFFFQWLWRITHLPRIVKSHGGFLFIPGTGTSKLPYVTMCQNLLPVNTSEMNRFKFSKTWLRLFILRHIHRISYKKASGIIFLNEYCRKEVANRMGVVPSSSIIIPHGILPRFFKVKNTYAFSGSFKMVYVSIINEYKHQWNVAKAVLELNQEGCNIELFLVGPEFPKSRKRLDSVLKAYSDPDKVKILGSLDYSLLDTVYSEMDMAIYASTCESFGITLLEAMASSLPIACSKMSSMPEMLNDAGIYFHPENIVEIKSVILKMMSDEGLRKDLGTKAHRYAMKYNWGKTAQETFSFINEISQQCAV